MVAFSADAELLIGTCPRLNAVVPEKNTFVHFDDAVDSEVEMPPRQKTCPELVQRRAFRTKTLLNRQAQHKALLHAKGECKPCAYFAFKADGCRLGDDCEHCHLCTRTQIRRKKRAHAKKADSGSDLSSNASVTTTQH